MRRAVLVAIAVLGVLTGCATSTRAGTGSYAGPPITPSSAPSPSPTPPPPPPQVVTAALTVLPENLNPYSGEAGFAQTRDLVQNVLPSAFVRMPSYRYRMNTDLLRSARSGRDAQGRQVIRYVISPQARWSDGTPITADDFRYLWQQSRQRQGPAFAGYDRIGDVVQDGPDPKHVVVHLAEPFAAWQSLFDPLLPARYLRRAGWQAGFAHGVPVSAGPFAVATATAGRLVLRRDERYFGTPAHLKRLTFLLLPSPGAAVAALSAGRVDIAAAPGRPAARPDQATVTTSVVKTSGYEQLLIDTASGPTRSPDLRRAIAYALDRKQLYVAAGGVPAPAGNRLLPPGWPGYRDNGGAYGHDAARARSALRSAQKGGAAPRLRIVVPAADPDRMRLAQVVQAQLHAVGIDTVVTAFPPNLLYAQILPHHAFDLALTGYVTAQPALDALDSYGCSGASNETGYCDRAVDALLQQAIGAADEDAAAGYLDQADRRLWQAMPTIPLVQRTEYVYTARTLSGPQYDPGPDSLYWNAATWKVTR